MELNSTTQEYSKLFDLPAGLQASFSPAVYLNKKLGLVVLNLQYIENSGVGSSKVILLNYRDNSYTTIAEGDFAEYQGVVGSPNVTKIIYAREIRKQSNIVAREHHIYDLLSHQDTVLSFWEQPGNIHTFIQWIDENSFLYKRSAAGNSPVDGQGSINRVDLSTGQQVTIMDQVNELQ